MATYGRLVNGDDGFALPFSSGHSYTGEESVEFSVHGSPASLNSLVNACVSLGARLADPGEFTLRAFMNGRIDLTEAEGVRDTVAARTDAQLRQANSLRLGEFRSSLGEVRDLLVSALAAVEASTDFSEEIGGVDRSLVDGYCASAHSALLGLLSHGGASRIVREGLVVAIVGLPNAGKSSLFNALVGADRAIVTPFPGTTRDTIGESVSWGGRLVHLVDTAGIRSSLDSIESLGVTRTMSALENADLVMYVYDSAVGWGQDDDVQMGVIERPVVIVANKCDLASEGGRGMAVSATLGSGLEELVSAVLEMIKWDENDVPVLNQRHEPILHSVVEAVSHARKTLADVVPDDLAAVDLRAAINLLGEVTGETAAPDVIERIFADFCIGK